MTTPPPKKKKKKKKNKSEKSFSKGIYRYFRSHKMTKLHKIADKSTKSDSYFAYQFIKKGFWKFSTIKKNCRKLQ